MEEDLRPTPGSPRAKEVGCTCSGRGFCWGSERIFEWSINWSCPIHGMKSFRSKDAGEADHERQKVTTRYNNCNYQG